MEEQIENNRKIIELYNQMQKKIINYSELKSEYLINSFEIYKIHVEGTLNCYKNNLIWYLSLKVFAALFEQKNNFKIMNAELAEYIDILINFFDKAKKEISSQQADKVMINILFEKGQKVLEDLNKLLFNLKIDKIIIYLYFVLIKFQIENTDDLINYLALILNNHFPDCDFIFEVSARLNFFQYLEKINNFFEHNQLNNYSKIKYDEKKEEIIQTKKSNEEILNSIELTSNIKIEHKKKSTKKKQKKKHQKKKKIK